MRMVGQPCLQISLNTNSATEAAVLFWRASASGHLLKRQVQVAMYSFPLSVFGRGPTRSIPTVCHTWSVTGMGWIRAGVLLNLGLARWHLSQVLVSYMQDILDDTHPVVSLLNFLHNFVSTKVSSTDWVIMASLEDLSLLVKFDNL